MKRNWPAIAFGLCIPIALLIFTLVAVVQRANAQDESAIEIFRMAQSDDYDFASKDDAQDWSLYYIFREFDQMREDIRGQFDVTRDDIREVRGWLWAIAGGGAGVGAGGGGLLAWRKRRNGRRQGG